ncbi:AHH domain-containing protein [Cystobacter fuscus]|uniref:AHH domain-containing protein n=1 Tax=Cystobacter fuscus TaxID=43 RepID=UPI002B2B8B6C|nr:hypothetical protein F0U63_38765 [Cystobacter fuscus]
MLNRLSGPRLAGTRLRPLLGGWLLLVLFLQSACTTGAPRAGLLVGYRYKSLTPPPAPRQHVTLTPSSDFAPVQVSDSELREAFTQLVLEVPLRVATRSTEPLAGHPMRVSWPSGGLGDTSVEEGYARLCERRGSPGDCNWLLGDGPHDTTLDHRDRFALALGLALTPAMEAASGVLQDASAHAMTALLTGLSLYLVALIAPEPISKGLALAMTVFLWAYLGHEFWGLISATKRLWDEVEVVGTFHELRGASERYARVLGPNTLRVLLMLATWKAGAWGKEAMQGSGLPGFPQAVRNAATWGRFHLPTAASEATSVSVAEGRLVITLPSGSGALLAMQQQGEAEEGPIHHIATVENEKSPARGGPWTPRLKKFFDKAGMSMEDPANKVRIPGHKGPHPEAYHQDVFKRLERAVRRCETTAQCRESLSRELKQLATELRAVGSRLNKLVTQTD